MSGKDGGHAFPNITPDMNVDGGPGMTLRDYFAAKAMATFCATQINEALIDRPTDEDIAKWAYQVADAMLAERSKT